MKHIVQEVLLVLLITIISIMAALFIAHSVQSEPLNQKDPRDHSSIGHLTPYDSGSAGVVDGEFEEKL